MELTIDWRARMAALLLAGGALAACGSSAAPDAGTGSETQAQARTGATKHDASAPRPRIPVCNANPDPYCRSVESAE